MALWELFGDGASTQHLYHSPTTSLWTPCTEPAVRCTRAAQEFGTQLFNAVGVATLTHQGHQGDLVAGCYLQLTLGALPSDVYGVVDMIRYEVGGQTIEEYNGDALRIIASYDRKARVSAEALPDGRVKLVYPLRLCTSMSTHTYLPLICLALHEVNIHVRLAPDFEAASKSLCVQYIGLGPDERRTHVLGMNKVGQPYEYQVTQKIATTATVNSDGVTPSEIDLDLRGPIRDLVMLVHPLKSAHPEEPLRSVEVLYGRDRRLRHSLDAIFARRVIPAQLYDVDANEDLTYFVPFDHTPLDTVCSGSLAVDAQRDMPLRLVLKLAAGDYRVTILARCMNAMVISHGIATLKFPKRLIAE